MIPFKKFKIGIIGCGMISDIYLTNLQNMFTITEVVGCADIKTERSRQKAEKYSIRQMTNQEIYDDPEIDIVVNLTYHTSHVEVTRDALNAGKHVYSEKMIAPTFEEGKMLYDLAKQKNLLLCAAPDTFLGAAMQTARQMYDSNLIGTAVAGNAVMVRGYHHERFRTDPEKRFAFSPGGGILFDMGCYYIASLLNLLGPIKQVCGFSEIRGACDRRYMHPDQPLYGDIMTIESPNNTAGVLWFESGAMVTLTASSESINATNYFTIHGTDGRLDLIDPNEYSGETKIKTKTGEEMPIPCNFAYTANSRGLGVADMCYALLNSRPPRANSEQALHMLEAVCAIMQNSGNYKMTTTCTRPAPFKAGITEYPEMVLNMEE